MARLDSWNRYNKENARVVRSIQYYSLAHSINGMRTSESLYSVQNIAIHRIRLIFGSSNTLVYRLGPSNYKFNPDNNMYPKS